MGAITPSRVVQFLNMYSADDLVDDEYYEELRSDLETECLKYGLIETIEIPRPDRISGVCSNSVGKAFVKFQYLIPAKKARQKIAGRTYNKRTVITSFYPEEKFDFKDYLKE